MDGSFSPPAARSALSGAIEQLVRRYDRWFRPALRKRFGDQADDLAHEAYLRTAAYDASDGVRHHKAFLLRVAENLARDRARQQGREQAHAAQDGLLSERATPASQEQSVTLKQIVLALPPELRDVFVLTHIQGLTYREIARLREIPERTVKDRMRRALARVAAAMQD